MNTPGTLTAQVAQQLTHNDALTIGYVTTNGRNMQFLRNGNLIATGAGVTGTLPDGRPIFASAVSAQTRVDPRFNSIELIDTGSNSSYNALLATFEHRMSAGLVFSGSYTWSHSINDTPEANSYEFSNPVEDSSNFRRDRSNSSINRPNSFTPSSVYQPDALCQQGRQRPFHK